MSAYSLEDGEDASLSVSYWGAAGVGLADLKQELGREQHRSSQDTRRGGKRRGQPEAAEVWALPNMLAKQSNVIVLRIVGANAFVVDSILRAEDREDDEPGVEDVDQVGAKGRDRFRTAGGRGGV